MDITPEQAKFTEELQNKIKENISAHEENLSKVDFDSLQDKRQAFLLGMAYVSSSTSNILQFVSKQNEMQTLLLLYVLSQSINDFTDQELSQTLEA